MSGWIANAVAAGARGLAGATVRWLDCAPEPRQRVYFANHTSHLDFVVLWSALPRALRARTRPVAAKDYWQSGIRRRLAVNVFHAVLVERGSSADRDEQLQTARRSLDMLLEALAHDESLIIFPEGTRSVTGVMADFKPVVGYLALHSRVGILPVYLDGTYAAMPKGTTIIKSRDVGARIGTTTHSSDLPAWVIRPIRNQPRGTRLCSNAYAVAPARVETPILQKMFERCREIVFTLKNSAAAISWLVRPAATSRRTSTSRSVSPAGSNRDGGEDAAASPTIRAPT